MSVSSPPSTPILPDVEESTAKSSPAGRLIGRLRQLWRSWWDLQNGKISELPRSLNSLALILGRVAASGLGFLTWLIAARLYATEEVGIASGIVSAMMLCVQLGLLGVGSAIINLFPDYQKQPARLLDTALGIVVSAALITAGIFLLFASALFNELSVAGASLLYILLFLALTLFGTVNVLFDHVSIAVRRGDEVLTRNVFFGVITIAGMGLLSFLLADTSQTMILAWVLAGLGACLLGIFQLWRSALHYKAIPAFNRGVSTQLLQIGLPNYLLTLAERAPNWIMPIVVTELLSPTDNAHWYAVWMMAWVVFIIPISVGQNLFAEVSRHPDRQREAIRHSMRTSLTIGGIAALGVAIFAPWLLALLGSSYADEGSTPLRILVIGILPFILVQAYYAVCRGTRRLREATLNGVLTGLVSIGAGAAAGVRYGLTGIAVAWLAVQILVGIWVAWRLYVLSNGTA